MKLSSYSLAQVSDRALRLLRWFTTAPLRGQRPRSAEKHSRQRVTLAKLA